MTRDEIAGSAVFDRLVSALSGQERQDMLARIRYSQVVDEAPLRQQEPTPETRFERVFAGLTLLERIVLFLRTILSGRERVLIIGEIALRRIAKSLGGRTGGGFNPRSLELQEEFFEGVEGLREAAELFRRPLRDALRLQKRDFVAFLAGMEMPIVQEHLLREADPTNHDRAIMELSEFDMKRALDSALQDALDEISEGDRQVMYRDVQLLHWLQGLADFGFDRLLARVHDVATPRVCPANTLIGPMKELAAVLARLSIPPTTQLVGLLFLFSARDRLEEKETNFEELLQDWIERAREALAEIRRFNESVPLNDIIRVVVKDADWMPTLRGGGEDWFVLFKQFWTDRQERRVSEFVEQRKRKHLLDAAVRMLKLGGLPYLSNYRSNANKLKLTFSHEHSIAFLRGFLDQVYEKILARPVKIFLLDGKFYKDDNRRDFTDACNAVDQLADRIRRLDAAVSSDGRHGTMLLQITNDEGLPASKARAVASIAVVADKEAELIVADGRKNLVLLQLVLDGILHGHGDETYDTISNLSKIGGRENGKLISALRVGVGQLAAANEILSGFLDLEGVERE